MASGGIDWTQIARNQGPRAAAQIDAGGQAAAVPAAGAAGTNTNTAGRNPDLDYVINQEKKRFEGDMGAGRSIDIAGQKIREAALGGQRALDANVAQRVGGGGGGLGDILRTKYESGTQRAIAGSATDIAEGRERDRDQVLRDIASAGGAQAGINLADRSLALQQQAQLDADRRAEQAAQNQQIQDIISQITGVSDLPAPPQPSSGGVGSGGLAGSLRGSGGGGHFG